MSEVFLELLEQRFGDQVIGHYAYRETTLEVKPDDLLAVCKALRDEQNFEFDMLIDVTAVDYLQYGQSEWETNHATASGFDRGVERDNPLQAVKWKKPRFAVVYHLLSTHRNRRLRLKVFVEEDSPMVDSVIEIWPSANWFERETFDMFGILFKNHPDLRRILTDYGFSGHPFRKDFPLSGHVEVRYDKATGRVIYAPVDIKPRVLVPKVIRDDSRYELEATRLTGQQSGGTDGGN